MAAFRPPQRTQLTFEKENDQEREVEISHPAQTVFLHSNSKGTYIIKGKIAKLIAESCSDCVLKLDECMVVAGMLELINCTAIRVQCSSIPTITADNCTNCVFQVPPSWGRQRGQGNLITSEDCDNVTITSMGEVFSVNHPQEASDLELGVKQYTSRFAGNQFVTELVIREGCGYATTIEDKRIADEKAALNGKIMQDALRGIVRSNPRIPQSKSTTVPQSKPKTTPSKSNTTSSDSTTNPKPSSSLLNQISTFSADALRPTTTHVSTTSIPGSQSSDDITEYFDTEFDLAAKIDILVQMIRDSKYMVAYTGAGISTSAKIPDYRGPQGVWTLRDRGEIAKMEITIEQAEPTYCHMALQEMIRTDVVKCIVSTNVDGLHRRAGTPAEKLAELHGNCYLEKCTNCNKDIMRTFDVTREPRPDHKTGRKCECGNDLADSIIHFGENLPEHEMQKSVDHATKSDLSLVLGTSMKVQPACTYPLIPLDHGGRMVIINLQKTPSDSKASLIIRARTDDVMRRLCQALEINVSDYQSITDAIKSVHL